MSGKKATERAFHLNRNERAENGKYHTEINVILCLIVFGCLNGIYGALLLSMH